MHASKNQEIETNLCSFELFPFCLSTESSSNKLCSLKGVPKFSLGKTGTDKQDSVKKKNYGIFLGNFADLQMNTALPRV